MKTTRWALVLAALAFAGCNGDDDEGPGPDTFLQTLAGKWTACVDEEFEVDYAEDLTITATSLAVETRFYQTTDGTCAGAPISTETDSATFVLGGDVAATMGVGGRAVTARAADVTGGGETFYTIVYVDTAATPDALYLGDESVDPLRDGSTPATRPNVLQDWKPRVKQ